MRSRSTVRWLLLCLAAASLGLAAALQPASPSYAFEKMDLWDNATGPHLRGALIYQRRNYDTVDGPLTDKPNYRGTRRGVPVGAPFEQRDFDLLASAGANAVIVSFPGVFTEDPPYVLRMDIVEYLDGLLEMIEAADLFAVLAIRSGPGRSEFTFFYSEVGRWFEEDVLNDSIWASQEAQDAWVEMWRFLAERYRDSPIIAGYELMVEPNSNNVGSDAIRDKLAIWDPQQFYRKYGETLYDWNQLFPRIIGAIREVDSQTPIIVDSNGYSGVDWLEYTPASDDPRTIYAAHNYSPHPYTHQSKDADIRYPGSRVDIDYDKRPDEFDRFYVARKLRPLVEQRRSRRAPLAVTEFGVARWAPGAARYLKDNIDVFERNGLNHFVFKWSTSFQPYGSEVSIFNFKLGTDPNETELDMNSALLGTLGRFWSRNTVRPSTFLSE